MQNNFLEEFENFQKLYNNYSEYDKLIILIDYIKQCIEYRKQIIKVHNYLNNEIDFYF